MCSPRLAPIYRDGLAWYGMDTCQPQLEAVRCGKISLHALTKGHYPGLPLPSSFLPGLNSIGFWDGAGSQDWGLEAHRNDGIELSFLETGTLVLTVEQQRFDLHAGSFTITRPWQLHRLGDPYIAPGRLHWLILDVGVRRPNQEWRWPKWVLLQPEDLAALTRRLRHTENPVWPATPGLARVFRSLAQCILTWGQPHSGSRITVGVNQLLVELLGLFSSQQKEENRGQTSRRRTVELFLRDLAKNPVSNRGPWTLDRMANHCGMGITVFSQYCRELVNSSPVKFLNECRLDHAARALREHSGRSVTEIAFESGFNSSQYFATRFRQRFHVTPLEYRQHAFSSSKPVTKRQHQAAESAAAT